ncbi:MAG: 50S ribosomal protein L44e [Promethearchaeia archaeon]
MKFPKTVNRYCPHCRKHQKHTVTKYKKKQQNPQTEGARRFERKKQGYGSFPREIFHKNAKLNKKTTPLFECLECGKQHYGKSYRVKKFELQEK